MGKSFVTILLTIVVFALAASCSGKDTDAASAAVGYYEALIDSDYVAYTDGMAGKAQLPSEYREQFVKLTEFFVAKMDKEHGGLCGVELKKSIENDGGDMANVFLELSFRDSTKEEVLVPMVLSDGQWLMK
ncbi:MAG: hypothetical protein Q4F34_06865 [Prevotellaceae bacterium]|nr:hypothetical protein [Prevotellaceae bacterium]